MSEKVQQGYWSWLDGKSFYLIIEPLSDSSRFVDKKI